MKKGFLKALATVTVGALLLSANAVVFAATPTFDVSTTHNASTGKVSVDATIYDTAADEQIAFLVEKANGDVAYMDQEGSGNGGTVAFSFTADESIGYGKGSTVKFGTTNTPSSLIAVKGGGTDKIKLGEDTPLPPGLSYDTVTKYVEGSTTEVSVKSSLYNVPANQEVAFIVMNDVANLSNVNLPVFIDQKNSGDGGAVAFEFVTAASNAEGLGTAVQFTTSTALPVGTVAEGQSEGASPTGNVSAGSKVTYSAVGGYVFAAVDGSEHISDVTDVVANPQTEAQAFETVKFFLYPAAGYTATGMTVTANGVQTPIVANHDGSATWSYAPTANTTLTFNFVAVEGEAAPTSTLGSAAITENSAKTVKEANIVGTATNAAAYGVLVSFDEAALTAIDSKAELDALTAVASGSGQEAIGAGVVRKYAALGSNTAGQYSIQLVDEKLNGEYGYFMNGVANYYVRTYAVRGDVAVFSNVTTMANN